LRSFNDDFLSVAKRHHGVPFASVWAHPRAF
jgi:hypothetical protein